MQQHVVGLDDMLQLGIGRAMSSHIVAGPRLRNRCLSASYGSVTPIFLKNGNLKRLVSPLPPYSKFIVLKESFAGPA
jgi:hypothetical protein